MKYKSASFILRLVKPFNATPLALFHRINSFLIVKSFGFTFTFFNRVEEAKAPEPKLYAKDVKAFN